MKTEKKLNSVEKKKLIFKRGSKCEECGQTDSWNNKKLVLQVDHVDGNSFNNKNTNLKVLCPNCHSQTGTFSKRKYEAYRKLNITNLENASIKIDSIPNFYDLFKKLNINYRNPLCVSYIKGLLSAYNGSNIYLNELKTRYILGIRQSNIYAKYGNTKDYAKAIRIINDEKNSEKIRNVLNSDIKFDEFGWVVKISKIINISPQKVNKWMKRNLSDFYEENCFKRNKL